MDDLREEKAADGIWLLPGHRGRSSVISGEEYDLERSKGIARICTGSAVLIGLVVVALFFSDLYSGMKVGTGLLVFLILASIPALFQIPMGISAVRQHPPKAEIRNDGPACTAGVAMYVTTEMATVYRGVQPSQTLLRTAKGFPFLAHGKEGVEDFEGELIPLEDMVFLHCGNGSIDVTGVAPQALMELLYGLDWFAPGVATQPPEQDPSMPYPERSLPWINAIMSHPQAPPSPFCKKLNSGSSTDDDDIDDEDLLEYEPPAGESMSMPANVSVLKQSSVFSPLSVPLGFCLIPVGWLVLLGIHIFMPPGAGAVMTSVLMGYLLIYMGIFSMLTEGWPFCDGGERIWFAKSAIGVEADSKTYVFSTKLPLRWIVSKKTIEQGGVAVELPKLDIAAFQRQAAEVGANIEIS